MSCRRQGQRWWFGRGIETELSERPREYNNQESETGNIRLTIAGDHPQEAEVSALFVG